MLQRLHDQLSDPNDSWSVGGYFALGVVGGALTFLAGLKMLATAGSELPHIPGTVELVVYTLFGVLYFPLAYTMSGDMPNTGEQAEHRTMSARRVRR